MIYEEESVRTYKEMSIKTANPAKIVVMLYDEAIKQLDHAVDLLKDGAKHFDKVNNAIGKAQDIITELLVSLDLDQGGEIAQNLFSLYVFFNKQLTQANIQKKNGTELQSVRRMLAELRESWNVLSEKNLPSDANERLDGGINIAG